jgi:hypothetical protein
MNQQPSSNSSAYAKYIVCTMMGIGILRLLVGLTTDFTSASEYSGLPDWESDWVHAEVLGDSKPRLVLFFQRSSKDLAEYEKTVLSNPDVVAKLKEDFVLVKVDATYKDSAGFARAREYRVWLAPALMILYPNGKRTDLYIGLRTPGDILFWSHGHAEHP